MSFIPLLYVEIVNDLEEKFDLKNLICGETVGFGKNKVVTFRKYIRKDRHNQFRADFTVSKPALDNKPCGIHVEMIYGDRDSAFIRGDREKVQMIKEDMHIIESIFSHIEEKALIAREKANAGDS